VNDSEFEEIREIPDLFDRAKAVLEKQDDYRQAISTLSAMRREILNEIRASGVRPAEMAKRLGVTSARMSQLLSAPGPGPERAFFGDGRLTVVAAQKFINGNHTNKGVGVAVETIAAYHRLAGLAASYQLDTDELEDVPQPGIFELNRNNLIVLAGPRLFPMVRQMLAGDPNIRFEADGDEWTLHDVQADATYRATPRDADDKPLTADGPARDFGYLGRLPRPDGKGTFLCFAGVHATGTQGVVAYLEQNLPQLYGEVKTRLFSTIVECEYTHKPRKVTSAKPASPIYKRS
jgi:hypothetical protein